MEVAEQNRDHLFISYAWEDVALAEWLTMKLTAFGYKVWCDRIKLLGGESFPTEIDDAIKTRTHRLLALMSHASLRKPNPLKERTLAIGLAKERGIDFLIPLNLGVKPTELSWMVSDLTYIDFTQNWASGLDQLLKALQKANSPCPLADGRERVCQSVVPAELFRVRPETLCCNSLPVTQLADALTTFEARRAIDWYRYNAIKYEWPCYHIDDHKLLAFHPPSADLADRYGIRLVDANRWRDTATISGVNSRNVVSNLLRLLIYMRAIERKLTFSTERHVLHFPQGLVPNDNLPVLLSNGKKTTVLACGERSFFSPGKPKVKYAYHLAPVFSVCRDVLAEFAINVGVRLFIRSLDGSPMEVRSALSRQKKVTHDWWNYEWMVRHLAIGQFLADASGKIMFGDNDAYRIVVDTTPSTLSHPFTLNDDEIERRRKERRPKPPTENKETDIEPVDQSAS